MTANVRNSLPILSVAAFVLRIGCAHAAAQTPLGSNMQQLDHGTRSPSVPRVTALTVTPEGMDNLRLIPGSAVDVTVFEENDLNGSFRLDHAGNIVMPLAGTIALQNLTLRQAEEAISAALIQQRVLKVAHVVVNLNEYATKNITVVGEVGSPGRYAALAPRSLIDVLAMAGGETAVSGDQILIHRADTPANQFETVLYGRDTATDTAIATTINPGDTVNVKRAGIVYVLGSVNRPGGYVLQEDGRLNVLQALALAFGTAPGASPGSMRVLRHQPDGTVQTIPVEWKDINKGKKPALALRGEDILFVPSSKVKSALIQGNSVISAAASATIYSFR